MQRLMEIKTLYVVYLVWCGLWGKDVKYFDTFIN